MGFWVGYPPQHRHVVRQFATALDSIGFSGIVTGGLTRALRHTVSPAVKIWGKRPTVSSLLQQISMQRCCMSQVRLYVILAISRSNAAGTSGNSGKAERRMSHLFQFYHSPSGLNMWMTNQGNVERKRVRLKATYCKQSSGCSQRCLRGAGNFRVSLRERGKAKPQCTDKDRSLP